MLTEDHYAKLTAYATKLAWRRSTQFVEDVVQDACIELLRWPPAGEPSNALLYTVCKRMVNRALRGLYEAAEVMGAEYDEVVELLADSAISVEDSLQQADLYRLLLRARAAFSKLAFSALTDFFFRGFSNQELEQKYGGRSAMQVVYQQRAKLARLLFRGRLA